MPRNIAIGQGIASGAREATSNILNIMMAKQKIDDQKERTKILNQSSKAQIAMSELKLKDATNQAAREERMMQIINRQGGGGISTGGQREPGGNVGTNEVMPGLDWSYNSDGKMTLRPKAGMTPYQQQQQLQDQKEIANQKNGVIGIVNSIKDQVLNKGTFKTGGEETPYTSAIPSAISNKFPKADMNDPEIQQALFSLENMSSEFRPSFGIKAAVGRGRAKLSRNTKEFIKNVKSQEDVDKLVGNRAKAEAEDIDVDAILEYFGQRR